MHSDNILKKNVLFLHKTTWYMYSDSTYIKVDKTKSLKSTVTAISFSLPLPPS